MCFDWGHWKMCLYDFDVQIRFWRLDLEKDFLHKCQNSFSIALYLHVGLVWDFWMGNSFNFFCLFVLFCLWCCFLSLFLFFCWLLGFFTHCIPIQRCRICALINDFLIPVFQLRVIVFQRRSYWTLHGLRWYRKWTQHHSLFLGCLIFSQSWGGGRRRSCCFKGNPGSAGFGLFYIGMKCQQSGISGKGEWSFLAHLSAGDPEHQMGAWVSRELESKFKSLYQLAGQPECRPVANQAASKRMRHLARGRMVEAVGKLWAGQQVSWAGASRALGQLARVLACWLDVLPDDHLSSC